MHPKPHAPVLRLLRLLGAAALAGGLLGGARALRASEDPADAIVAALPNIPDARFRLTDYGAVGDGKAFDTDAIKKAIAAVEQAGGGHLIIPAGTYKTLPFSLVSRLDLHLDPGATLVFPTRFADYKDFGIPDPNNPADWGPGAKPRSQRVRLALISGSGLSDVAITGSGTIDGSGAMFWQWSDKAARRYPPGRHVVPRPLMFILSGMQRLHIEGVTLTNSPMFHLLLQGDDMTVENIRIVAPSDSPNTDGIDPAGHRIVIRGCEIDTGDDHVALHSGSSDMLVEDLTCLHGHGISIGSGTVGGLSHVFVRNCTFDGADNGLRIKSYRGGGGEVRDIHYSHITMKNVRRPFDINMRYDGNAGLATDVGPRQAAPGETARIPHFHDIHIDHLSVIRSPLAGRIVGIPEQPAADVTFTDCSFDTVRGFLVEDARDIVFDHVRITAAVGQPLVLRNASVDWNGQKESGTQGGSAEPFY